MMRDPVERLVSQYVHEWSVGKIDDGVPIDRAVRSTPELIEYSRYAMQIRPYLGLYGRHQVLPVFVERLQANPPASLRVSAGSSAISGTRTGAVRPPGKTSPRADNGVPRGSTGYSVHAFFEA